MLEPNTIRQDFPLLSRQVHEKPLVYLDNAATTQRPNQVIDAVAEFYRMHNANVHRGVHTVSDEATEHFELARQRLASWINAEVESCIFTKGTTESINLIAASFAETLLEPGDEIILTQMEHHANIVPWQVVAAKTKAVIRIIPVTDAGELDLVAFEQLLSKKTRLVAVTFISNVLGTVNPVKTIIEKAHAVGAYVMIDGAQALAHETIDVKAIDCDFLALSAHKAFGPTGIGAVYVKPEHFDRMRPYQTGGEMIRWVSFEKTEYNDPPYLFEAGTPNIAGAVGMRAAIDYLADVGIDAIKGHEKMLWDAVQSKMDSIPGLRPIGLAKDKIAIFSFVVEGAHANDIGLMLDTHGIAVRTGHHCAMPLLERFGESASVRASFSIYNTLNEVELFFESLADVVGVLVK